MQTNQWNHILFSVLTLVTPRAFAQQEDVLVEATAINEERIEPSRSFSIIDEDEIKRRQSPTVADLMRSIPGVEVVRQGAVGQTTSLFIRGARSEDTLVLIDGIESNDAMSPACGFDFSSLSPDNILRIEVYRGPQSVRFGAGALGGVINIVTKEGSGRPQASYSIEGGAFKTDHETLESSGRVGALGYSVGIDRLYTKGFSAADESAGNSEADGSEIRSSSVKMSWAPDERSKVETTLRYMNAKAEIDQHGGVGGDDPNDTTAATQLTVGALGSHRFFDDRLKSNLGAYFSEADRVGRNLPDPLSPTDSSDHFLSETRKIQSDHEFSLGEEQTLRLGLQWRGESGISDSSLNGTPTVIARRSQSTTGESFTYLFESSSWFFDVGARSDQSSQAGVIPSYRASLGRGFERTHTKVSATYGTGFKLPSLYELYSIYGDPNLHEERSGTMEASIEQRLGHAMTVSLSLFENRFQDLIDYDMTTNRYFNVSKARSRGFEIQTEAQLSLNFSLRTSYTYLDSIDQMTGLDLIRRPRNALSTSLQFQMADLEGHLEYSFKDERVDLDPTTSARLTNPSYDLINLGGGYRFSKALKANIRVENLLNRKYEEVVGYGTAGLSVYAGVSGEI